jgi:hypothetical protein
MTIRRVSRLEKRLKRQSKPYRKTNFYGLVKSQDCLVRFFLETDEPNWWL